MKTQNEEVLDYLKTHAAIDSHIARKKLGIERLAARIKDLKNAGHNILSHMKKVKTRRGETKVAEYWLN